MTFLLLRAAGSKPLSLTAVSSPKASLLLRGCASLVPSSSSDLSFWRGSSNILSLGPRGRGSCASFSTASLNNSQEESNNTKDGIPSYPELKVIPALPFIGSQYKPYSGIEPFWTFHKEGKIVEYWRHTHKENGPFYKLGQPGLGSGIYGEMYVVRDPDEMLKVIKAEGSFPSGLVQQLWPSVAYVNHAKLSSGIALFGKGEEWKRVRSFLQKDLLSPQAAREYMPSILEATKYSSQRLLQNPHLMKDLNLYLNFCSADMFLYVTFGHGATDEADQEEYDKFVTRSVDALGGVNKLMLDMKEMVIHKLFSGFETAKKRNFFNINLLANELATKRIRVFMNRMKHSEQLLTENEKNCYLYKLLKRQPGSDVTEEEVVEICFQLMMGAVDTTAAKTAWNIIQLALNQDYQNLLRSQLLEATGTTGGDLTAEIFTENKVPLLNAFIRETYRCTPSAALSLLKPIQQPVEVYGTQIPAGSCVLFDGTTNMMDPDLVDDPMTFRPERWLKPEVESRKGTPQAIIDHPFYSGPFSQGARRCPGSRVSYLEVQAILARLVLDYTIEGPSNMHWNEVKSELHLMVNPIFPEQVKLVPRQR